MENKKTYCGYTKEEIYDGLDGSIPVTALIQFENDEADDEEL